MTSPIIEKTIEFVKKTLENAEWWHDWFHIYRVWNNAKNIGKWENVDMLIVELGALLHDIADSKFYNWDEKVWPRVARDFLTTLNIDDSIIKHVEQIILNISFKWWKYKQSFTSPELNVVQDADRLDALWAMWIARVFSYWWHDWRKIYDPDIKPNLSMSVEEYKNNRSSSINHFYEKLLLLKDKMNTKSWKNIAEKRHKFMGKYLEQFYNEWEWKV